MAEKSATEKTEQPTSKRLNKARSQGQVPRGQELTSAVSIVVLVTMVVLLAPSLMQWFIMQMRQGMSHPGAVFANSKTFISFFNAKISDSVHIILPILVALFAGSIVSSIAVSGLNFSPGAITLKFDMANPITGLQNLVNAKSAVHLLTSIVKLFFVAIIVWIYIRNKLDMFAPLRWAWSAQILAAIAKIILGLMIRVCIALLIIGIADVFYQKWKYIKDLKMTRQEVKEEHKQAVGSPEIKRRIRQAQYQTVLKRILQEVPKANVVLVNPTHVAVALRYEAKTMEAPILVAKGAELLAEKIKEIARAYGVPVVRKPELARTIYSTVEPGSPIPETLYVAVAEVLAMIYQLRHKK
jgi:flagellar biosynthetic protein FlhB